MSAQLAILKAGERLNNSLYALTGLNFRCLFQVICFQLEMIRGTKSLSCSVPAESFLLALDQIRCSLPGMNGVKLSERTAAGHTDDRKQTGCKLTVRNLSARKSTETEHIPADCTAEHTDCCKSGCKKTVSRLQKVKRG